MPVLMCMYTRDIAKRVLTYKMKWKRGRGGGEASANGTFHKRIIVIYLPPVSSMFVRGFRFIFPYAITALSLVCTTDRQARTQQRIISVDPVNWKCKRIMKTWPAREFSAAIFATVDAPREMLLNNRLIMASNTTAGLMSALLIAKISLPVKIRRNIFRNFRKFSSSSVTRELPSHIFQVGV